MYESRIRHNRHLMWLTVFLGLCFWAVLYLIGALLIAICVHLLMSLSVELVFLIARVRGSASFWIIFGTISFLGNFFITLFWLVVNRLYQMIHDYNDTMSRLVERNKAKLARNHDMYPELLDAISELCVGLDLEEPVLYIIPESSHKNPVYNALAFHENDVTYLFVTEELVKLLNKYELEAVLADQLISIASGYSQLLATQYVAFKPIKGFFVSLGSLILIFGLRLGLVFLLFTSGFLIWMAVLAIVFLIIQSQYRKSVNVHLRNINTDVIHLTNNPDVLISAFTKMETNHHNFVVSNYVDDILWLKPLRTGLYRWPLSKQLETLKLF